MKTLMQLGLGLIGIGKPWGHVDPLVPPETTAIALLERAVRLGIRYFDTAPSYGVSEERLGRFLHSLVTDERRRLTIATKFGEHWDADQQSPYVDHSFNALRRSLDGSMERLGRIDILQLHKTTPEALKSDALARAWEYARSLGIGVIGASVSDLESAYAVVNDAQYGVIQLPFNVASQQFLETIQDAAARGLRVAVNRPFGMGRLLYEQAKMTKAQAFRFVLQHHFDGVILCGTKSPDHLEENWQAFQEARLTPP